MWLLFITAIQQSCVKVSGARRVLSTHSPSNPSVFNLAISTNIFNSLFKSRAIDFLEENHLVQEFMAGANSKIGYHIHVMTLKQPKNESLKIENNGHAEDFNRRVSICLF